MINRFLAIYIALLSLISCPNTNDTLQALQHKSQYQDIVYRARKTQKTQITNQVITSITGLTIQSVQSPQTTQSIDDLVSMTNITVNLSSEHNPNPIHAISASIPAMSSMPRSIYEIVLSTLEDKIKYEQSILAQFSDYYQPYNDLVKKSLDNILSHHIVIDKAKREIYLFKKDSLVLNAPVIHGKELTEPGVYVIITKAEAPRWILPKRIKERYKRFYGNRFSRLFKKAKSRYGYYFYMEPYTKNPRNPLGKYFIGLNKTDLTINKFINQLLTNNLHYTLREEQAHIGIHTPRKRFWHDLRYFRNPYNKSNGCIRVPYNIADYIYKNFKVGDFVFIIE